ncbi:class F sortase [Streptomyces oceani]|uniref:class F sortase n=1 Tax=Streptomyces oceani TaxID=1075402 RepID=UPI000A775870|nr:class F sortase [Streptomyces oceani]
MKAAVDPLKVNAERELGTPEDPAHTGWWRAGPEPGEEGPAVVVGHYDSDTGPAVFYDLERLEGGDPVRIQRADGSTATFRVRTVQSHSQDDFPTERVYGDTHGRAALRLITCGGAYDQEAERYEENVVVYATLHDVQQRDGGGS